MSAPPPIAGIHHITAIARDPRRTRDFYVGGLGLHLVKRTVNFDDPSSLHLYFGNGAGAPGTILTHFDWPHAAAAKRGSGEVSAVAFQVSRDARANWREHLLRLGVATEVEAERFGEEVLRVVDPDGAPIELVACDAPDEEPNHAVRGFHAPTLRVRDAAPTRALLVDAMGFHSVAVDGRRERLAGAALPGTPGCLIDLLEDPTAEPARLGAGSVHHIAFRTPNSDALSAWQAHLSERGFRVTPIQERRYFRSIYLRERGGILFEFATDDPGFGIDESAGGAPGERLALPPWLEPRRAEIEETTAKRWAAPPT